MLRTPAPTSLNAFTPSTPWAVTTPRYSLTGRPSIPGVVVMSISVPPYLRLSLTGQSLAGTLIMVPARCLIPLCSHHTLPLLGYLIRAVSRSDGTLGTPAALSGRALGGCGRLSAS